MPASGTQKGKAYHPFNQKGSRSAKEVMAPSQTPVFLALHLQIDAHKMHKKLQPLHFWEDWAWLADAVLHVSIALTVKLSHFLLECILSIYQRATSSMFKGR